MSYRSNHGKPRFRAPRSSYVPINDDNEDDDNTPFYVPQTTQNKFNILSSGSCVSVAIWLALISVFVIIIVVVAAVPQYGTAAVIGPTRTFLPRTTTSDTTETTTTSPAPTTTPVPALILSCPQNDVSTPLGFPLTMTTFGVTISGGCQPITQSTTDTLVGSIARKRVPSPAGRLIAKRSGRNTQAEQRTPRHRLMRYPVQAQDHGRSERRVHGARLPQMALLARSIWDNMARKSERSPSFPERQLSATSTTPIANVGGAGRPDFAMDSNINFVVTGANNAVGGATQIRVYTKDIVELGGSPFTLSALAQGTAPCSGGAGQSQVMWDRFANIWIILEIATLANVTSDAPTICLYATDGASPLTSAYTLYVLSFPALVGAHITSPKLANFNDIYTMSFVWNETTPILTLIDRTPIVTQQPATSYFTVPSALPPLVGITPSTWTPLDNRGEVGVPTSISDGGVFFMRQRDNSLDPAAPLPIQDYLDIMEYDNINFAAGNATVSSYSLAITNFDSSGPRFCIPVPDNSTQLYAGQEWLAGRLSFNGLSPPYTGEFRVVGTFTTQACTNARVQWFELTFNNDTSLWQIRQQGVSPATPGQFLWMPAITQDRYGNMLLVYSNSSAADLNYYPSLGAFSRSADDPLNTMRYLDGLLVWGEGGAPGPSATNGTWGIASQALPDIAQTVGRSFYVLGSRSPGNTVNTWQGLAAYIRMQGEIVQRNVMVEDVCGQTATCEFFILDGQI